VLKKDPDASAYTNEYVTKALDLLKPGGVDVTGASFAPSQVTLAEGGK
jgi:NitT/TauT family transport system substrate-binding protein